MRHHIYARVSNKEYETVSRLANRDSLSIANFMRRCVNAVLLEEGLEEELLIEHDHAGWPKGITRAQMKLNQTNNLPERSSAQEI